MSYNTTGAIFYMYKSVKIIKNEVGCRDDMGVAEDC